MTYSDSAVTYSDSTVTYSDSQVTQDCQKLVLNESTATFHYTHLPPPTPDMRKTLTNF